MYTKPIRRYILWLFLGLAVITLIAFWPVFRNDFVGYDDDEYVVENPHVTGGITGPALLWAFTTSHSSNWHPLTWISHMLDCRLYGLNPRGHHLTSLLFHVALTHFCFSGCCTG